MSDDPLQLEQPGYALRIVKGGLLGTELFAERQGWVLLDLRELVWRKLVFMRGLAREQAQDICERFAAPGEGQLEAVEGFGQRIAYDPDHSLRGAQPLERVRWRQDTVAFDRLDSTRVDLGPLVSCGSPAAAHARVLERCRRWLDDGKALARSRLELLHAVSARNAALEAELRAAEDPMPSIEIYADWLQAAGDPRGLLAATELARRRADTQVERERLQARFDALLEHHAAHLFGPLADLIRGSSGEPVVSVGVSLEWLAGFVVGIAVFVREGWLASTPTPTPDDQLAAHELSSCDLSALIPALVGLPICAGLRSLTIGSGSHGHTNIDPILREAGEALVGVRMLELGGRHRFSFSELGRSLPRLERLRAHDELGDDDAPARLEQLRELMLDTRGFEPLRRRLATLELPRLTSLELRNETRLGDGSTRELGEFLRVPALARLRSLSLRCRDNFGGLPLLDVLPHHGELGSLERLELIDNATTPPTPRPLRLPRLEHLRLTVLTHPAAIEQLFRWTLPRLETLTLDATNAPRVWLDVLFERLGELRRLRRLILHSSERCYGDIASALRGAKRLRKIEIDLSQMPLATQQRGQLSELAGRLPVKLLLPRGADIEQ